MKYDLAIAGGGLAGLALAIQVRRAGFTVVLFEKEMYPFHRVCGEYISYESWPFLLQLGLDLEALGATHIRRLLVSAVNGKTLEQDLPLGGFGITRYKLDFSLVQIARRAGVEVFEQTRVNDIQFSSDRFKITTSKGDVLSTAAAGCFGKRSNLDVKWKRPFITARKNKINNYVGVKYHIRHTYPDNLIGLHSFDKGYCGISKVETGEYCLCYLTSAENLLKSGGDVRRMEQVVLSANPHLRDIFNASDKLQDPVTISQISFAKKSSLEDHVLMIGDAAGMIAPLCGNGMSMALHGSKIAAEQIEQFLGGEITREEMERRYSHAFNRTFGARLRTGRVLQRMLVNPSLTRALISVGTLFPGITKKLIAKTHGQAF